MIKTRKYPQTADIGELPLLTVDVRDAGADMYAALHAFATQLDTERFPDDPPIPLDESIRRLQNMPGRTNLALAVICDQMGCVIARAGVSDPPGEENPQMMFTHIAVLSAYRGQGFARRLLNWVVGEAEQRGRTLLCGQTYSTALDGAAFAERIGAQRGQEGQTNQLVVTEVDRQLLYRWQEQAQERAADFEVDYWNNRYPEEAIDAFTELVNIVVNDIPRDDLQINDWHWTPEQKREQESFLLATGAQRWVLYARERSSRAFVGYTAIYWHPNRPHLAIQGGTGVAPRFRNCGLGRWLKAAMLERVIRDRPQVQFVRTSNANSNVPMLRINQELGFRPYIAECTWQVAVERVRRYLETGEEQ